MSATANDEVGIIIGNQTLSGWQDVSISRGIERFPSSFDLIVTERYPGDAGQVDIPPGSPVVVTIGDDTILTGYVDRYTATMGPNQHQVHITGRSMCEDLVDCSAAFPGYQINNSTMIDIAKQICYPLGIQVMAPDGNFGPIPNFNIILTETGYEIIERITRYANFLAYDDTDGNLVLAKVGDTMMASGFSQGVNVQEASVSYSADQRFTEIDPVYLSQQFLTNGVEQIPIIPNAPAKDQSFPLRADGRPRFRLEIVVSEQTADSPEIAKNRAAWEMARRVGRSQAVTLTCDSWRDSAGTLWQPNALAPVNLPSLKLVNAMWLISDVIYRRGAEGTTAEVTLMPPAAFKPEIDVLVPFDWQVGDALPGGGATNYTPAPR